MKPLCVQGDEMMRGVEDTYGSLLGANTETAFDIAAIRCLDPPF